jgi:hypothetical protein
MKPIYQFLFLSLVSQAIFAGDVEKTYTFSNSEIRAKGAYQTITLERTLSSGLVGEPMLPYHQVALMLPPGETATAIEIAGEELTAVPGSFKLFPQQAAQPLSEEPDSIFRKNEAVYSKNAAYPENPAGHLINGYLNGYSFALSTFTPVIYNPATGSLAYYKKVTVRIKTSPDTQASAALSSLPSSENALKRVRLFAQNGSMMDQYPLKKRVQSGYEILIITPEQFQAGFQDLASWYNGNSRPTRFATIEAIGATMNGQDLQEKIRNFIIQEYQANGIDQVILGGDIEHVPYRGFYCYVRSGWGYEDFNIPADIYYSALDGNWNKDGNARWGEPGEEDLLPEISVGRMSFSNGEELAHMVHKSVSYQSHPVTGELANPLFVSEKLYDTPVTWGSDYLELLVDGHNDNGYATHGIPEALNNITRLSDTSGFFWAAPQLYELVNSGQSFIHHSGHTNSTYMMRLGNIDITDQNFSQVNGITHNYQLMYTHGCICGAFDKNDCIAEKGTTIANWLVAGVFNSRYGWFNQGTTEGPSAHLHREFVSALYHPDPDSAITELGAAHTMSKIKTAPWVGLPGEFEPGAQRWCHYGCNVLGDPALKVWTNNPSAGLRQDYFGTDFTLFPNPANDEINLRFVTPAYSRISITIVNSIGQKVLSHPAMDFRPGTHAITLSISDLPEGLYFCRMETREGGTIRKLLVVR